MNDRSTSDKIRQSSRVNVSKVPLRSGVSSFQSGMLHHNNWNGVKMPLCVTTVFDNRVTMSGAEVEAGLDKERSQEVTYSGQWWVPPRSARE